MDRASIDPLTWMNNGFAVVVLIAVGVCLWKLSRIAGRAISHGISHAFDHLVVPMKDAAIGHLAKTNSTLDSVQQTNREICETLKGVRTDVAEVKQLVTTRKA